jgi:ABC-2 type transport system permease protein
MASFESTSRDIIHPSPDPSCWKVCYKQGPNNNPSIFVLLSVSVPSWYSFSYRPSSTVHRLPTEYAMRLYYEVGLRAFRRATMYRLAYVSGIVTNAFFGAMLCYVYLAVYAGRETVAGYTIGDSISYLWAAQAMISLGGAWLSSELAQSIRTGDVAVDLMRPWNYYFYWVSRQIGDKAFNFLIRGTLTYAVGVIFFEARLPALAGLPGFILSITFSIIISCAFTFLICATAFWMLDNNGVINISSIMSMFFSGFLIPLAFFPPWLSTIAQLLPFQAITSVPVQIFLGRLQGAELLSALALQVFWAVVLTAAALGLMRLAMRKIVIQGG